MGTIASTAMAVAMLAAILLVLGGIRLIRLGGAGKRGWLMIVAAAVLVGNILILTL